MYFQIELLRNYQRSISNIATDSISLFPAKLLFEDKVCTSLVDYETEIQICLTLLHFPYAAIGCKEY